MKSLLQGVTFVIVILLSACSFGQMFHAINLAVDYPTPGMSDGKINLEMVGNYPNPVQFEVSIGPVYATVTDSLTNLSEADFAATNLWVSVIDMVTQDTVEGLAIFPYVPTEDFSMTWTTLTSPTSLSECDGHFDGTLTNGVFPGGMLQWYPDFASYQQGVTAVDMGALNSMEMLNLCPGFYVVTMSLSTGGLISTFVNMEPLSGTSGAFDVEVFTTPSSTSSCTATATATVTGGVAPFQYFWDTVAGTDETDSLCPGIHSVKVIDANNDSTMIMFGVADSDYFYEDPYTGIPDDTIYFMTEDCGIDYGSPIDSIAITYVDFYASNEVIMGFTIWQGVSSFYVQDTSTYGPPEYGLFLIDLTQFCLNKAIGGDVIKYTGTYTYFLSTGEPEAPEFMIYPNPADDVIVVPSSAYQTVRIYNMIGELVLQPVNHSEIIHVSTMRNGVYQVVFFDENDLQVGNTRVIVTH